MSDGTYETIELDARKPASGIMAPFENVKR